MRFSDAAIPAGFAWSSPFTRWQGALAETTSLDTAAAVTGRALRERGFDTSGLNGIVLGWTVPQPEIFYGAPLLAARLGAEGVSGAMLSQACATSVAALAHAAGAVDSGAGAQLVVTTDRTSNGPLLTFPEPSAQGGAPLTTHWVLDSFARDPWAGTGMLTAGDLVAEEHGFSREELDDLTVLRFEQYRSALAEDRAFQRRYMVPVELKAKKGTRLVEADEGVRDIDPDVIRKLPAAADGAHTYASQTHPADGCAGSVVTTTAEARELAGGGGVVRLLAAGTARVAPTHMPEAPVPAALNALRDAGMTIDDVDAVTTHNPFAVNDLYFSRQIGYPVERMNARGSSLIFGHPQGPTGMRSIAELIEELRLRGGGTGLFTGCAAGDTGMALVLRVED